MAGIHLGIKIVILVKGIFVTVRRAIGAIGTANFQAEYPDHDDSPNLPVILQRLWSWAPKLLTDKPIR
jgi:hypothetical protein